MQVPRITRLSCNELPPIHHWPLSVKRIILVLAIIACIGAYLLLIGGGIGILMALALD